MLKRIIGISCAIFFFGLIITTSVLAAPNRVRVINETNSVIYVHKGGYAPSVKILPKQWKIFLYPFKLTLPNSSKKIESSLLIATSGGRWMTTPNGFTYLSNPNLCVRLDYKSPEHRNKTSNRVWTIKRAKGLEKGCEIQGYHQPWYQKK